MTKKEKNSKIELLVARIIRLERLNVFFRPKAVENMAIYRPSLCHRRSSFWENNLYANLSLTFPHNSGIHRPNIWK